MTPSSRRATTLTQWIIEERRRFPSATGGFNRLVLDVASACKAVARAVALSHLERTETAQLEAHAHELFLDFTRENGSLAGLFSNEQTEPQAGEDKNGEHLLVFEPLDGSSNVDINAPLGSIFSVLHSPGGFLQKGALQVAAGYALYGPATMLVLSVGTGVHAFTLDPSLGDFMLTHRQLRIPAQTNEFAINASNSRFWESAVKRYVNECLAGTTGPRGKDFNMRWIASPVAEAHRLLLRGGVFLDPFDASTSARPRLITAANPIGFLVEQAGGRASTGEVPILDVAPTDLGQRTGLVFGSKDEVERIERYHTEPHAAVSGHPLFNHSGLFRD